MDNFTDLLRELGAIVNVPLHPDKHGVCKVMIDRKFSIQIEYDPMKNRLLFLSFITEIPPGKFRENVLKEALKANGVFPRTGTLGLAERTNQLTLHDYYYLIEVKADKLADYLTSFIEKVNFWKTQIESGNVPSVVTTSSKNRPPPFLKL